MTKYAAKFVELAKFYPHYTPETAEFSKCIKFENGLRADIKRAIGYQKIRNFSELVRVAGSTRKTLRPITRWLMREKEKGSKVVLSPTVPLQIGANSELMMRGDL